MWILYHWATWETWHIILVGIKFHPLLFLAPKEWQTWPVTLLPTSSPSNAEPKHFLELRMRCAQFSSPVAEGEFSKRNVIFSILSYVLWVWDVSNALWWTLVFGYMCAKSNLFCLFKFLFGKAWLFSAVCLSTFFPLWKEEEKCMW